MPRYNHVSKKAHRRAKRRFRGRFVFQMARAGVNIRISMDRLGKALADMTDRMLTGVSQNQIFWRGSMIDPVKRKEIEQPKPIFTGFSPFCPKCGEFHEGEPIDYSDFNKGYMGEQTWIETHVCPTCGQRYSFTNGDS